MNMDGKTVLTGWTDGVGRYVAIDRILKRCAALWIWLDQMSDRSA
jgi:hypothetical protein